MGKRLVDPGRGLFQETEQLVRPHTDASATPAGAGCGPHGCVPAEESSLSFAIFLAVQVRKTRKPTCDAQASNVGLRSMHPLFSERALGSSAFVVYPLVDWPRVNSAAPRACAEW